MKKSFKKLLLFFILLLLILLIVSKLNNLFPFNGEYSSECTSKWSDLNSAVLWANNNKNKSFNLSSKLSGKVGPVSVNVPFVIDAKILNSCKGTIEMHIDSNSTIQGTTLTGTLNTSCDGVNNCSWDSNKDVLTLVYNNGSFFSDNNGHGFGVVVTPQGNAEILSISLTNELKLQVKIKAKKAFLTFTGTLTAKDCFV